MAQGTPVTIDDFQPRSGKPGSAVITLVGTGLNTTTYVEINGVRASWMLLPTDWTRMWVFVPNTATTGPITLITPAGRIDSREVFTVIPPEGPEITRVSPTVGVVQVGGHVIIEGKNLLFATEVKLDETPLKFEGSIVPGALTAYVPFEPITGRITVITPYGVAISNETVTIQPAPPPVITRFNPKSGPEDTIVRVDGQNLSYPTNVTLNGVSMDVDGPGDASGALLVQIPGDATNGPIRIQTRFGDVSTAEPFVVTPPEPPVIFRGPREALAGDPIQLIGLHFRRVTSVTFNGVSANFTLGYANQWVNTAVPTNIPPGPVAATVVSPQGTATYNFTVLPNPAPRVDRFWPPDGAAGQRVVINGFYPVQPDATFFAGTSAYGWTEGWSVIAFVPTNAATGPISVLTARFGTGVSKQVFRVATDLALSFENLPDFVRPTETNSFSMVITNRSYTQGTDVTVQTALDANVKLISAMTSQGTHSVSNNLLICNLSNLTEHASARITVAYQAITAGPIRFASEIFSKDLDPRPLNNYGVGPAWALGPNDPPALIAEALNWDLTKLYWPAGASNYVVEVFDGASPAGKWSVLNASSVIVGNRCEAIFTNSAVAKSQLFRLQKK